MTNQKFKTKPTIVYVDDDVFQAEALVNQLSPSFEVKYSSTVQDFQKALVESKPKLVLLDVFHGDRNRSEELISIAKEYDPNCKIVMVSTYHHPTVISKALQLGAMDYIVKSEDPDSILNRLEVVYLSIADNQEKLTELAAGRTMQNLAGRVGDLLDSAISSVLICGESGTGKEVVVDLFDEELKHRGAKPVLRFNCGSISEELLSSELFGHVKGAFTGATASRAGLFEAADGGWLFLDEIGSTSPAIQTALLRAIDNNEIKPLGSSKPKKINVRVIAATLNDLNALVEQGRFRHDLLMRLRETQFELPPLRERKDEIPALIAHFAATMKNGPYSVSQAAEEILKSYSWSRGNIRELRNCLKAMTEKSVKGKLTPLSIPPHILEFTGIELFKKEKSDQAAISSDHSERMLVDVNWTFQNGCDELLVYLVRKKFRANNNQKIFLRQLAAELDMSRSTLSDRLKQCIQRNVIAAEELGAMVPIRA